MKMIMTAALGLGLSAGIASAEMSAQLTGGWTGGKIPAGQHCQLQGGKGGTPPMRVSGVPAGATWIIAQFNDKSYKPLSRNGGHGTIAFPVRGAVTDLPAVPGMTKSLPGGAQVVAAAKSSGDYASPGYLPPCLGGRNNRYSVDLKAVDKAGKVLAEIKDFTIGRY